MLLKMTSRVIPEELEDFFASALAERAARGIHGDAIIDIIVEERKYHFTRRKKRNKLLRRSPGSPDVTFWVPAATMEELLVLSVRENTSLGTLGIFLFDMILHPDLNRKIKFRVEVSVITLWRKGYFSVLKEGGPEVASYLAKLGFSSISQIKAILQKMRG